MVKLDLGDNANLQDIISAAILQTLDEMTVRASSSATFGAFTLANDAGSTFEYVPARLVARNVSRMVGNRAARRRYAALVRRGVKP